jgi:peroxiredoxin
MRFAFPAALFALAAAAAAQTNPPVKAVPTESDPKAGHSAHGEAFDSGPRQKAYLMPGVGRIDFPATTVSDEARRFFVQGVAQLHGFWYWEAERSFRQAAALDPKFAMAYWGMAMANTNNEKRARPFIAKAESLKAGVPRREQLWIEAYAAYFKGGTGRERALVRALENIAFEFPDDVEARAFLAVLLWNGAGKNPINSHMAVDAVIGDVLRANPDHPGAHHYRIHLWDGEKPARAVLSADQYGPSQPAVAHAWHMPGHIYSGLQRYSDAAIAQEASARVDHAYQMRDGVMPYQIHNYAHNNQWAVTSMSHIGRVRDAAALAGNLIEIPRHPTLNKITSSGSAARFGRARLLEVLTRWERWDEVVAACEGVVEPTEVAEEKVRRLRALGAARAARGELDAAEAIASELDRLAGTAAKPDVSKLPSPAAGTVDFRKDIHPILAAHCFECHSGKDPSAGLRLDLRADILAKAGTVKVGDSAGSRLIHLVGGLVDGQSMPPKGDSLEAGDVAKLRAWIDQGLKWDDALLPPEKPTKAAPAAKGGTQSGRRPTRGGELTSGSAKKAVEEVRGRIAAAGGDHKKALEHYLKAGDLRKEFLASAYLAAGDKANAEKTAQQAVDGGRNQIPPLASQALVLHAAGKTDAAAAALRRLGELAGEADRDLPMWKALAPVAAACKMPADWVRAPSPATARKRAEVAGLGPLTWSPSPAAEWTLTDADGKAVSPADYRGRPVLVLMYLGFGCTHCVEQLKTFALAVEDFREAGVEILAVGTDELEVVRKGCTGPDRLPFRMAADPGMASFRAWRAFDDFENAPLHGVFLLDGRGRIRWQDTGPDPFMDVKFLLGETRRLLAIK